MIRGQDGQNNHNQTKITIPAESGVVSGLKYQILADSSAPLSCSISLSCDSFYFLTVTAITLSRCQPCNILWDGSLVLIFLTSNSCRSFYQGPLVQFRNICRQFRVCGKVSRISSRRREWFSIQNSRCWEKLLPSRQYIRADLVSGKVKTCTCSHSTRGNYSRKLCHQC